MTFYEVASLLVWLVSSVAVVYSLYQVHRQTRLFARQTDYLARSLVESRSQNLVDESHEITRLFVAAPELRPYFYYGQKIDQSSADYHRAEAVAELILDIFWNMAQQAQRQIQDGVADTADAGVLWQDFVGDSFGHSPILVETLTKRKDWYGQEMFDQMSAALKRHEALPPHT